MMMTRGVLFSGIDNRYPGAVSLSSLPVLFLSRLPEEKGGVTVAGDGTCYGCAEQGGRIRICL